MNDDFDRSIYLQVFMMDYSACPNGTRISLCCCSSLTAIQLVATHPFPTHFILCPVAVSDLIEWTPSCFTTEGSVKWPLWDLSDRWAPSPPTYSPRSIDVTGWDEHWSLVFGNMSILMLSRNIVDLIAQSKDSVDILDWFMKHYLFIRDVSFQMFLWF